MAAQQQTTQVEGQVMEKVQQHELNEDDSYYYLVALMMLFFVAGFGYQFVSWPLFTRRGVHR